MLSLTVSAAFRAARTKSDLRAAMALASRLTQAEQVSIVDTMISAARRVEGL